MSEQVRDNLRNTLRHARSALGKEHVHEMSLSICNKAATLITNAQHVAGYYAFGTEVDLSSLMNSLDERKQTAYVPIVMPHYQLRFAPVTANTTTTVNHYGIKEPVVDESTYITGLQLDAVLVPLVGFDEQCNRMGMGGGYYDRCFERTESVQTAPLLIGVAYEMQCVDTVHAQEWDVPLDYVVTESRIVQAQRRNNE